MMYEDEIEPLNDSLSIKVRHNNYYSLNNSLNNSFVNDGEDLRKSQEFFRHINQDDVFNDDVFLYYKTPDSVDTFGRNECKCRVHFTNFKNGLSICKRYIVNDLLRDIGTVFCFIKSLLP